MSTSIYKHRHHIIPKHAGGSNDSSNLVYLTIPEHAEFHKYRYEMLGEQYDYIAWKAIAGLISGAEARVEAARHYMKHRIVSKETKEKHSKTITGRKLPEVTKKRMSKARMGEKNHFYGKTHTDANKKKISERTRAAMAPVSCIHCHKEMPDLGPFNRWHRDRC
jgi:hypothetical protein